MIVDRGKQNNRAKTRTQGSYLFLVRAERLVGPVTLAGDFGVVLEGELEGEACDWEEDEDERIIFLFFEGERVGTSEDRDEDGCCWRLLASLDRSLLLPFFARVARVERGDEEEDEAET